ncbi:hypothetical protein METP1_00713 [Methanosarcinales archaeon]|nr:hypothetical protein METP1_00713 [Methanosarcinales archaeon]
MIWKMLVVSCLLTLSLFSYIGMASEITINPDKTISINGKKTFPIYTYGATTTFAAAKNDGILEIAQRYDFTLSGWGTYWCGNPDWRTYQEQYEKSKLPYAVQAMVCSPCPSSTNTCWPVPDQSIEPFTTADRDAPQFFGYVHIDEPLKKRYANYSNLKATYNALKKFDPDHPVIVNHNPYDNTAANDYIFKSQDYADIISEDHYTIRNTYPTKEDYLYYFEVISLRTFAGGKSVDNYTKPFWAVIQANGKDAKDAQGSIILKTNPDEVRLETFNAMTIGYNGIGHWAYNSQVKKYPGRWENVGTWTDPVLWQGVKDLYNEIKKLNDILVLPDVGRSWYQHENDATVLITHPNMNKTISRYGTFRKINYVLKRDASINIWYLIVVNKDKTSLSNVKIKVRGLTGNMTAKTLGTLGTGSGAPGRSINVNNGLFTDSFDGYAVHIYEISSSAVSKYNADRPGVTPLLYYKPVVIVVISMILVVMVLYLIGKRMRKR